MLYLVNFQPYLTDIRVYPYRVVYPLQMESIEFAPITIFYGSNGSGKSTLLNIIAESVGVQDKTLGNTNEYFSEYVRKCTYTSRLTSISCQRMVPIREYEGLLSTLQKV